MADLVETLDWADGVYQIEQTDPVVGGPPNLVLGQGIANVQAQQLADRTGWLKAAITALQNTAVAQADINAAIAALRDGAPGALDTLNELATALGDNDNAMAAIITQIGLKLDATSYTAADILAKIIDEHAQLRSLYINSLGHVGDGGNDYGLIIKAFEPAITLADRSDNAGSVQMRAHADGALWLLRDVLNDTTIGHSSNTTTKVFVKFTRDGPIFYDNSGTEIGRITSAGFVGAGASLTGVNADKVDGLHASSFVRSDAANYRIPLGSFSDTNYDGIVYSDGSNFFKFLADQNVTASEEQAAGNIAAGRLRLIATNDLSLSSTAHAFQIGKTNSANIGMDNNEIQARDNGAASNLYLNSEGGDVKINGVTTAKVTDLVGYGQSWQDVSANRSVNTSYQNTTGKALEVAVTLQTSQTRYLQTSVDGVTFVNTASCGGHGNDGDTDTASISIPDGHYYRINGSGTISNWAELRA